MAKAATQADKGLQWFEKPFTIKQSEGLPDRILSFVEKCTEPKPSSAKELLLSLLNTAETQASVGNLQELNNELTSKLEIYEGRIEELESKLSLSEQNKEVFEKETSGLLQENTSIKEENERLTQFEGVISEFLAALQAKLPEVLRENDNSPVQSVDRIAFLITELRSQVTEAQNQAEEAQAALEIEKTKPAKLQPGQAIVGFPPKQREELSMLRMLFEKMGHRFQTNNVEEVVHYTVSQHIEVCRQMVGLCKDYAALLEILNP